MMELSVGGEVLSFMSSRAFPSAWFFSRLASCSSKICAAHSLRSSVEISREEIKNFSQILIVNPPNDLFLKQFLDKAL
jgi:hypothetical protein